MWSSQLYVGHDMPELTLIFASSSQLIFNNQFQPEKHIDETIAVLELEAKEEPKSGFKFPKFF